MALAFVAIAAVPARAQSLALEASPYPGLRSGSRTTAIAEGTDGRLWFAYADAVQVLDGSQVVDLVLQPSPSGRTPAGVRCIAACPFGRAYFGTHSGLWVAEPGEKVATCLREVPDGGVWSLAIEASGAVYVRTSISLERLTPDGTWSPLVSPLGEAEFSGVVAANDAIWCWSDELVWRVRHDGQRAVWDQRASVRDGDHLVVAPAGANLYAVHADELLYLEPHGHPVPLTHSQDLIGVRYAAAGPEGCWLASAQGLWFFDREQRTLLPVLLFQRGSEVALDLSCLFADADGLLWVGSHLDALRAHKPIGIEHFVFDFPEPNEAVTSFASGADGSLFAGTSSHRLLELHEGRWRRRDTPWPVSEGLSRRGIECMHVSSEHGLVVGSATHGVWAERDDTWARIEVDLRQALLHTMHGDPQGGLWLLGDHKVLRRATADAAFEPVQLPRSEDELGPAPASLLWMEGETVLATFRHGLLRQKVGDDEFRALGEPWPGNGLLNLLPSADAASFHVVTSRGLWRVERSTGSRTLLHETAPSSSFRASAAGAQGRIWLTAPVRLACYDPRSSRMSLFVPREGAHPLGYSWRAAVARRSAEVWFGAKRGMTRVRPEAGLDHGRMPRVLGFDLEVAGRASLRSALGARHELPAGTVSMEVRPRIVDRLRDAPVRCRVLARDERGQVVAGTETGVLTALQPGVHTLVAEIGDELGVPPVVLGSVHVPELPFRWNWPLVALGLVSVGLGLFAFRSRRSAQRGLLRRIAVDRLLSLADRPAEQTLDVAFLAVASGEECARRSRAVHTTVFLAAEVGDVRVRLAEFGLALDDAEDRAKAVLARGRRIGEATWILQDGDRADVVLGVRGAGSLAFQVFLHRVVPGEALLAECALALAPVQSGLRKQAWLERLESDFAHQSARLAAGMHDLRGSLTALRTSAFALGEGEAGEAVPESARRLADSAEHVLSRVERLLEGLESSSGVQLQFADPAEVVRRTLTLLRPRALAKGIRLESQLPESIDGVQIDPSWFGRAVENVVGNAVKFSPPSTTVRVHSELTVHDFVLHVHDQGPGIQESEREAVFLPGVTGSAQPTGGERQSGLGLWVARQAVRAMGGRLWVAPTTEKGARVSLVLPRSGSLDAAE